MQNGREQGKQLSLLRLTCGAELGHFVPSCGYLRACFCVLPPVGGQLLGLLLGPVDLPVIRKVSLLQSCEQGLCVRL